MQDPNILCLFPSPVPIDPNDNEFLSLSTCLSGYILSPTWEREKKAATKIGRFEYHRVRSYHWPFPLKAFLTFAFYVFHGWKLHRTKQRVDAIVAYGPFTTAYAGLFLRFLTGAPLIVDFPANPITSYQYNSAIPGRQDRIKLFVSKTTSPFIARAADRLRLLFPGQLRDVVDIPREKISAFHYYTAVSSIEIGEESNNAILVLGGPFYRKGVDLAIEAFKSIEDEFPDLKLTVVGYSHDEGYFRDLAAGDPRIEILKPVLHSKALKMVQACRVLACPSRAEGMPRVVIEAMTAAKPIVAAAVDGIPHYLDDGREALIVKAGDSQDLAEKLRRILSDPTEAREMGAHARAAALEYLSEAAFAEYFRDMIDIAMGRLPFEKSRDLRLWRRLQQGSPV